MLATSAFPGQITRSASRIAAANRWQEEPLAHRFTPNKWPALHSWAESQLAVLTMNASVATGSCWCQVAVPQQLISREAQQRRHESPRQCPVTQRLRKNGFLVWEMAGYATTEPAIVRDFQGQLPSQLLIWRREGYTVLRTASLQVIAADIGSGSHGSRSGETQAFGWFQPAPPDQLYRYLKGELVQQSHWPRNGDKSRVSCSALRLPHTHTYHSNYQRLCLPNNLVRDAGRALQVVEIFEDSVYLSTSSVQQRVEQAMRKPERSAMWVAFHASNWQKLQS
ncbi:hypothetical protein VTK56DRAFT_1432 [Thermocarpiscus australiensis]